MNWLVMAVFGVLVKRVTQLVLGRDPESQSRY